MQLYFFFLDIPAWLNAIAIACLRLFAIGAFFGPLGLMPALSLPALYSRMVFAILACWPFLVVGFFILLSTAFHLVVV